MVELRCENPKNKNQKQSLDKYIWWPSFTWGILIEYLLCTCPVLDTSKRDRHGICPWGVWSLRGETNTSKYIIKYYDWVSSRPTLPICMLPSLEVRSVHHFLILVALPKQIISISIILVLSTNSDCIPVNLLGTRGSRGIGASIRTGDGMFCLSMKSLVRMATFSKLSTPF